LYLYCTSSIAVVGPVMKQWRQMIGLMELSLVQVYWTCTNIRRMNEYKYEYEYEHKHSLGNRTVAFPCDDLPR
jgi:hypothetical protein